MKVADNSVLPDFSDVRDFADIQNRFFLSGRAIIQDHVLVLGERQFHPTSLELYLKLHRRRDIWWDGATDDGANEQYNRGTWYVRQEKGPRYWRIDITAGNLDEGIQAGILVRQLDGLGGQQPGPNTALHRIVGAENVSEKWTQDEIDLVGKIHGKRVDGSDGSPLTLGRLDVSLAATLGKGKRFNYPKSKKKKSEDVSFSDAHLRISLWRKYSGDEAITDDGLTSRSRWFSSGA